MLRVAIKKELSKKQSSKERLSSASDSVFALNVNFTVEPGITVLCGASGSGKTTCLRCIAGLITPDEGTISVDEVAYFDSIRRINLPPQQRRVGYVFQDYALFPHLTAKENIAYGVKAESKLERNKRAVEMLVLLRLDYAANHLPHELSGGEQQRVALARALASDPLLLLLDEPLSAVDESTRLRLLDEVEAAQRESGIPFLYVTHNRSEANRLSSHHITLEAGRILHEEKLK